MVDLEDFEPEDMQNDNIAIFAMATYGEGDPTDNAIDFNKWIKDKHQELEDDFFSGLKYTVFGLGNRQYEHYNKMGRYIDKRLEALGGTRIFQYGEGDDDQNLDEDFYRLQNFPFDSIRLDTFFCLVDLGFPKEGKSLSLNDIGLLR